MFIAWKTYSKYYRIGGKLWLAAGHIDKASGESTGQDLWRTGGLRILRHIQHRQQVRKISWHPPFIIISYFIGWHSLFRSNRVKLISPTISAVEGLGSELCFSFWFAAFGAGDSTVLKIIRYRGVTVLLPGWVIWKYWNCPVLRIRDVYPGSRIPDPGSWFLPIPDPGSRIPDPGSRISDPGSRIQNR